MSEVNAPPASADDNIGPGQLLGQLRAQRKLSVGDVAQRLKYGVRQIEALEAEEFSRLPGTTFVRGMIRGYAKLLEIDPELVLKSLDRRNIPGEISVDLRAKRVPFPDGVKRPGTQMYLALSVIALSAVLVVLYEWHTGALSFPLDSDKREVAARKSQLAQKSEVSTPPASADPVTPTLVVVETPLPSAPSPSVETMPVKDIKRLQVEGRIFLEFEDESWVEIKDSDGKTLMAQLNPSGSRRLIAGQPPFSLVIGNAAAVRVVYNDAPVDLRPYVKVEVARLTLK